MNRPTTKMINFAKNIAEALEDDIDYLNIDSYEEVAEYIANNKDDFYQILRDKEREND